MFAGVACSRQGAPPAETEAQTKAPRKAFSVEEEALEEEIASTPRSQVRAIFSWTPCEICVASARGWSEPRAFPFARRRRACCGGGVGGRFRW